MRNVVAGVALAMMIAVAAPVRAQAPFNAEHVTNEPGATLLLPYFAVQLPKKIGGKAPGINTLFSINNASASAALVHVTIWSDFSVPVFGFNVYLTGYDVQPISMLDLVNGTLPVTGDAADDPTDTISNKGSHSQDINFPGNMSAQPAQLDEATINHIRAALTGKPSPLLSGQCLGRDYAEKKPIARGYVTVDSVVDHTALEPNDINYFTNVIDTRNILWGDSFFINKSKKIGRADTLVAVRASTTDPQVNSIFEYSFYDTTNGSLVPVDKRQPLGSVFAGRFVNVPKHPFYPGGTSAIVWRDSKVAQAPFICGQTPTWFPLSQRQLVAFDEQENPELLQLSPFPGATQIVKVGGPTFPVSAASGWLYMDLNAPTPSASGSPIEDPSAQQAFVTMVFDNVGKYSVGARAVVLDDAAEVDHSSLPLP
ncbi:MAG: hypothetical protein ABIR79_20720 [Candidatus Binatia bacterium]